MANKQQEDSALLQSIAVAKALKQQNEDLNIAFDDLKKEYIALQEELMHLRKEHQHEMQAKKSLETDCQNLYKKWNDELKIQATEFEKIQSEMIPNTEFELLRVKILAQLEIAYTKKLNWMKNEMEKYQDLYCKTLREAEISKVNHQNAKHSLDRRLNEQKHTLNQKINALKQENEALKQRNMDNDGHISLKQQIQTLKTQNMEHNQMMECLQSQISSLNQQNSKLNIENEERKCLNLAKIKESAGKLLIKNAEHTALKQRYHDIQSEFETIKQQHLSKVHELQKLESNRNRLMTQLEHKQKDILNLNESFNKKEEMMKQQNDKECEMLHDKIEALEKDIQRVIAEKEKLKSDINTVHSQHLIEIQHIKQEHFTNFNHLIESKQELDKQYQLIKCKLTELQTQSEKDLDMLSHDLEKERVRIQQMEKEKTNLSELHQKKDKEIADLMNDMQRLKKENTEITDEYQALTNKYRETLNVNYQWTAKETEYVTQIEYLENDIHDINKKIDNKIKDITLKYDNKIKQMAEDKNTNERALNKVKKEKAKYKKLATTAKLKANALSKELMNIKKHFQTELKGKEFEITNLNEQIQHIERERDEIKLHLTMDHNKPIGSTAGDTDLITQNVDVLLKELQIQQNEVNNAKRVGQPSTANIQNIDS